MDEEDGLDASLGPWPGVGLRNSVAWAGVLSVRGGDRERDEGECDVSFHFAY